MSVVRVIPYQNRLAKLIKLPGGKRVEDALESAEQKLKEIEPPCLEALDDHIARIVVLASNGAPEIEALDEIYGRSNDVVGLGGVFGLADLSRAAWSLCDLVDRSRDRGGPSPDALKVHIDSLRLLRLGDSVPAVERRKVLDGLGSVVKRTTAERAAS